MNNLNQQKLLEEVLEIAKNAGEILISYLELNHDYSMKETNKTIQGNFATEADVASENYIIEQLQLLRPQDTFVGEESGSTIDETQTESALIWYIDPLDGTSNYSRGNPDFAVSISATRISDGKAILGVVHAPLLHKTWWTTEQLGFSYLKYRNETHPLPKIVEKRGKILSYSFGHDAIQSEKIVQNIPTFLEKFSSLRNIGSCAIELCYLAEGIWDTYVADSVYLWDFSAGAMIVKNSEKFFKAIPLADKETFSIVATDDNQIYEYMTRLLEAN